MVSSSNPAVRKPERSAMKPSLFMTIKQVISTCYLTLLPCCHKSSIPGPLYDSNHSTHYDKRTLRLVVDPPVDSHHVTEDFLYDTWIHFPVKLFCILTIRNIFRPLCDSTRNTPSFAHKPRIRFAEKGHTERNNDVYCGFGQTFGGWYLSVFFVYKCETRTAIIIRARDMSKEERKAYGRK